MHARVHEDGLESRSRKQILQYRRHVYSDLHVREGSKDQWQRSAKEHRLSWWLQTCREQKRKSKMKRRMQAGFSGSHLDFDDVSWHWFCLGQGS